MNKVFPKIRREHYETLFKNEKENLIEDTVEEIQNHGFPYYTKFSKEERKRELTKLLMLDTRSLVKKERGFTHISQNFQGISLAWSYFPHHWEVPVPGKKTPKDVFQDKRSLSRMVSKILRYHDLTISTFRSMLRVYEGVQAVSNFRPTAAKTIYDNFLEESGVVWDMSCGFGGRLLGALSCRKVLKYIGTDPSTPTFEGLLEMKRDFSYMNKEVELYRCGSEELIPERNSLDLCFTSPPYFDKEQYSLDENQSFKKFQKKTLWKENFLRKTLENCYAGLKPKKFCLINIANVSSYQNLEMDTILTALSVGFSLKTVWYLELSKIMGQGQNKQTERVKLEPIFVFQKPE